MMDARDFGAGLRNRDAGVVQNIGRRRTKVHTSDRLIVSHPLPLPLPNPFTPTATLGKGNGKGTGKVKLDGERGAPQAEPTP